MLPLGRALVAPARPETVLRECRRGLEAGSAAAPALPCEVGDWKHSKLGDTHTHRKLCWWFCVISGAAPGLRSRHGGTA